MALYIGAGGGSFAGQDSFTTVGFAGGPGNDADLVQRWQARGALNGLEVNYNVPELPLPILVNTYTPRDTGATIADLDFVTIGHGRAITDVGAVIGDADTVKSLRTRVISDVGATIGDADAVSTDRNRAVADTGSSITDTIARAITRLVADTGASVSDSVQLIQGRAPPGDTGTTISDTVASAPGRAVADTGSTVTDSTDTSAVLHNVADTGAAVSDATATLRARGVADAGAAITDSTSSLRVRMVSDTGATVSDSTDVSRVVRQVADIGSTISDAVIPRAARPISDSAWGTLIDSFSGSATSVSNLPTADWPVQAWVGNGVTTVWSEGGGVASEILATAQTRTQSQNVWNADGEHYLDFKWDTDPTGQFQHVRIAIRGQVDLTDGYRFVIQKSPSAAAIATINQLVGGTSTQLGAQATIPGDIVAGTWYRAHISAHGSTLSLTVWPRGTPEPSVLLSRTDSTWASGGFCGFGAQTQTGNTNAPTISFDNAAFQLAQKADTVATLRTRPLADTGSTISDTTTVGTLRSRGVADAGAIVSDLLHASQPAFIQNQLSSPASLVASQSSFQVTPIAPIAAGHTLFLVVHCKNTTTTTVTGLSGLPSDAVTEILTATRSTGTMGVAICRIYLPSGWSSPTAITVTLGGTTARQIATMWEVASLPNANVLTSLTANGASGTPSIGPTGSIARSFHIAMFGKVPLSSGDAGAPGATESERLDAIQSTVTSAYAETGIIYPAGTITASYTPTDVTKDWVGVLGAWAINYRVSDTGSSISDAVSTLAIRSRSVSDTGTSLTENIGITTGRGRAVADTGASVSDSLHQGIGYARSVTDELLTLTSSLDFSIVPAGDNGWTDQQGADFSSAPSVDLSTTGSEGMMTTPAYASASQNLLATADPDVYDADALLAVRIPTPAGTTAVSVGPFLRQNPVTHTQVRAIIVTPADGSGQTFSLRTTISNAAQVNHTSNMGVLTPGSKWWIRLRASANNYYAKMWADGTPEPANWTVTILNDTSIVATQGSAGVYLGTGGGGTPGEVNAALVDYWQLRQFIGDNPNGIGLSQRFGGLRDLIYIDADWRPSRPGAWFFLFTHSGSYSTTDHVSDYVDRENQFGRKVDGHHRYYKIGTVATHIGDEYWSVITDARPFSYISYGNSITAQGGTLAMSQGALDTQIRNDLVAMNAIQPARWLIRFGWEMSGPANIFNQAHYDGTFPAASLTPDGGASYRASYRRLWTIMYGDQAAYTALGISGAPLRLSPDRFKLAWYSGFPGAITGNDDPSVYDPGSSYYHWITLEGYSKALGGNARWSGPSDLLHNGQGGWDWYAQYAPLGKPILFGEMGILPANRYAPDSFFDGTQTRENWWPLWAAQVESLPLLGAAAYWDATGHDGTPWRIDSDDGAATILGDSGSAALAAAGSAVRGFGLNPTGNTDQIGQRQVLRSVHDTGVAISDLIGVAHHFTRAVIDRGFFRPPYPGPTLYPPFYPGSGPQDVVSIGVTRRNLTDVGAVVSDMVRRTGLVRSIRDTGTTISDTARAGGYLRRVADVGAAISDAAHTSFIRIPGVQRRVEGVSYPIIQRSDATNNGTAAPPFGASDIWADPTTAWVPLVSLWAEAGVVEAGIDHYDWGTPYNAVAGGFEPARGPNLPGQITPVGQPKGAYSYALEDAKRRGKGIVLRVAAGHWSPPDWYTAGGVPDAGLTVGGLGRDHYAMPVVYHPSYRTRLVALYTGLSTFLSRTFTDGTPYSSVVTGIVFDAASDGSVEWTTGIEAAGSNLTRSFQNVDAYGSLALGSSGGPLGASLPTPGSYLSNPTPYYAWLRAAYDAQNQWGLAQMRSLFPAVPLVVAGGQLWGDSFATERSWIGGLTSSSIIEHTGWLPGHSRPPGPDVIDLLLSRGQTVGRALQAADSGGYDTGGGFVDAVQAELTAEWPDLAFFEAPTQALGHAPAVAALQSYSALLEQSGDHGTVTFDYVQAGGRRPSLTDIGTTITDAVTRDTPRPVTDTGTTLSDAISLTAGRAHGVSDTGAAIGDSVHSQTSGHPITDTGTHISDVVAANRGRPVTDTGSTVTDSVSLSGRIRTVADTGTTVSESTTRLLRPSIHDNGSFVTDTVRIFASTLGVADQGTTISDSVAPSRVRAVPITDQGATVTDSIDVARLARGVTDQGANVADTLGRATFRGVRDVGMQYTGDNVGAHATLIHIADQGSTIVDTTLRTVNRGVADVGAWISDAVRPRVGRTIRDVGARIGDRVRRHARKVVVKIVAWVETATRAGTLTVNVEAAPLSSPDVSSPGQIIVVIE